MNEDVASFYTHLKETTAQLLGYADADNLTAAQQIRLERAISLRLICDDTAARQMRGQPIDVRAFTDASENLERMVPGGNPEAPAANHDFEGSKAELEALLAGRAEAIRRRHERLAAAEAATMADIYRREELAAVMAALPDVGKVKAHASALSPSADNVVPLRDPELLRLASRTVEPQSAAERAESERAWRNSYGSGGAICAPPFFVDPTK